METIATTGAPGKLFTAGELKNRLSLLWEEALQAPVWISLHGRPKFVVLKATEYERYQRLEAAAKKPESTTS